MAPSLPTAAAAIAGTTATILAGRALDAKYSIRSDLAQIWSAHKSKKHWQHLCKIYGDNDWSFYHRLHQTHGLNDYDEAFLFEDRSWTYGQVRAEVGRLALAFQQAGIQNRTVVGMFINNSPEFYFAWWALFKIGAIPAPLNTSIAQEPFRHCLNISSSEYLICSFELYASLAKTLRFTENELFKGKTFDDSRVPKLKAIYVYDYGTYESVSINPGVTLIRQSDLAEVKPEMAEWPWESRPQICSTDASQYIFTSGTTGLPKAAMMPAGFCQMIANHRYRWPLMFEKPRRLYVCTPMFHGGATYALLPATVASGGTVILARRFSVRNFWHDVRRSRANMLFYIGEMARYLVQAPPDPIHADETKTHNMEILFGLGIAEPVWRAFKKRFGVPWICEYYGATEGTTVISYSDRSNNNPVVSRVAHWGPLMRYFQNTFFIIKVDLDSEEVVRDSKTGFCVEAEWDEVGEAINRIQPPLQRTHPYVGENGEEATERKILRDVFEKGDMFWRLGDALSMDKDGYVSFHDRLGDTFRNKGHNISTTEVEDAFLNHPQISSSNVYAISMTPYGYEGQVGCAAITIRDGTSADNPSASEKEAMQDLEKYLVSEAGLPSYAVPRFVRVLVDIDQDRASQRAESGIEDDVGSEHVSLLLKKIKTSLRKEGFLPKSETKDRMYWIEQEGRGFVPLADDSQKQLLGGKATI